MNELKYTLQQTFNRVVRHLRKQGRKALGVDSGCKYRIKENNTILKCAAGCLIPVRSYTPEFEFMDVSSLCRAKTHPAITDTRFFGHDKDLVFSLQRIHDFHCPDVWEKEFITLAADQGLSIPKMRAKP